MKLSEITDVLNRAKQVLGVGVEDAEVVLHAAEGDAETVIREISAVFGGGSSGSTPTVTLIHGAAPLAPPTPAPSSDVDPEPEPAS